MATVELRFSALPAHVRTARLVAASVARRCGVDEALLDEVRLAVGEACSRAVGLHRRSGLTDPVTVRFREDPYRFSVEIQDSVSTLDPEVVRSARGARSRLGPNRSVAPGTTRDVDGRSVADAGALLHGEADLLDGTLGLAVISGLVDDVEVHADSGGAIVRMSWPAGAFA